MWCISSTRVWSRSGSLSGPLMSRARATGPWARSKPSPASCSTTAPIRSRGAVTVRSSMGPGGSMSWTGSPESPSSATKRVRSPSCRALSASRAAWTRPVPSLAGTRRNSPVTHSRLPGSMRSSSHSRRWPKERGSGPVRGTGRTAGTGSLPGAAAAVRSRAWAAGVVASSSRGSSMSWPVAARNRLARRVSWSEVPPSRKKSSCTPMASVPNSSRHSPVITCSASVPGAASGVPPCSGVGSAARSSLPLGVFGKVFAATYTEGRWLSGSRPARNCRSSAASGSCAGSRWRTWAASRVEPSAVEKEVTALSATRGWAARAASTSPGSIRTPLIFTWWSVRPTYSRVPSARCRTRSPVR